MAEEVKDQKGIKEISELIDGVGVLARAGLGIAKDGKVNLEDLKYGVELAKKHEVLLAAFQGIEEVPAEIKDLSLEESQMLLMKLIAAVAEAKAA